MTQPFAETSFFCALYREQVNSGRAAAFPLEPPNQDSASASMSDKLLDSLKGEIRHIGVKFYTF
jgi:hypothetical protein